MRASRPCRELAPGDALGSFLSLWGVKVPSIVRQENVRVLTDVGDYTFRDASLVEDFRAAFPGHRREVDAFFRINSMMDGMMAGGLPGLPRKCPSWTSSRSASGPWSRTPT